MKVYKFRDKSDGNHAFILAASLEEALGLLHTQTSIPCELVDSRWVEKLPTTIIKNNILPF